VNREALIYKYNSNLELWVSKYEGAKKLRGRFEGII